jgi:hypothetical protein
MHFIVGGLHIYIYLQKRGWSFSKDIFFLKIIIIIIIII